MVHVYPNAKMVYSRVPSLGYKVYNDPCILIYCLFFVLIVYLLYYATYYGEINEYYKGAVFESATVAQMIAIIPLSLKPGDAIVCRHDLYVFNKP